MKRPDGQTLFLGASLILALVVLGGMLLSSAGIGGPFGDSATETQPTVALDQIPIQAERSFAYLEQICALGPRFSGSDGMRKQQELLINHFEQLGGQVRRQTFRVRHPLTGDPVDMANLVVTWHPERQQRILLCAHYDTRPFPDRDPDPRARRGIFIGANDGGSGVAVLMELAHRMPELDSPYGVDFVLFDGEELVYDDDRDPYFLGSRYFSQDYAQNRPEFQYRAAILLDMVGDKHLQLYQEKYSMSWADSRPIVLDVWRVARELGVREFIPRARYEIRDDHLMLHDVGGIPAIDIIDFDYGPPGSRISYWHTREDTPDKCSGASLAKVGWVVWEWLRQLK
jgi:hypothetical protein